MIDEVHLHLIAEEIIKLEASDYIFDFVYKTDSLDDVIISCIINDNILRSDVGQLMENIENRGLYLKYGKWGGGVFPKTLFIDNVSPGFGWCGINSIIRDIKIDELLG